MVKDKMKNKSKKKNSILILTTEGCEACYIAINNVKLAITQSSKEIELIIKDYHDIDKQFIKFNKIKDFPTVIYFQGNDSVNQKTGTYPVSVYLRWIDIWFK